jgi:hypothetical protein
MAFAAGLRFARLRLGEAVAGVASGAAARAAIGIDAADAGIGPGRRIEFAARQNLDGGAMALEAADCDCRRPAEHFAEEVIERGENFSGLGVMASLLLVDLFLVTTAAILGRYNDGNRRAIVLERVHIGLLGAVAVVTIDTFLAVRSSVPLLGQSRVHRLVALETLCTARGAPRGTRRRGFCRLLRVRGICGPQGRECRKRNRCRKGFDG